MCGWNGVYFSGLPVYEWVSFLHRKVYQWGIFFTQKVYESGKIWKIVYEWGQYSKIVYEWGQFSIWEVYEWVMFFTWPSIWMGWGSGTPAAHPYPKSWHVNPPPPWESVEWLETPLCGSAHGLTFCWSSSPTARHGSTQLFCIKSA